MAELKDSGSRREFATGAVRDIREGKGRCDLMPLDVISIWVDNEVLELISKFTRTGEVVYLFNVLFRAVEKPDNAKCVLKLSKHFERGAKKYGPRNWEKGIPISSYIDSAVRHYLKYLDGQEDENHFIAFIWNIICCIWTYNRLPEMRDMPYEHTDT